MDNLEQRLENVFAIVFPDLPPGQITTASQDSVEAWDSVAAITFVNLIEEEFGIEMDFEDVADLTSFAKILEYLKGRLSYIAI
jgi:acyl carrier protein